jgi:hypothetical protein
MKILWTFFAASVFGASSLFAQTPQGPLVPQPFPGTSPARPNEAPPSQPPAQPPGPPPAPVPAAPPPVPAVEIPAPTQPVQAPQGLPVYPTAEFIDGFDAGSGQRYYLYGTDMPFDEIVAYYRNVLKNGGRELFREPPTRQFDLGRYQENTMAYPPSVVVKDYTWNGGTGYLAVSGTTEKRYRTIIQIVPVTVSP